MSTQAVLNYPSLDSPVIFHQGRFRTLKDILCAVNYLDEKLPPHQHLLNLYENRYYFLLGFLLGLKRQSKSLFPSTITSHVLDYLTQQYSDILLLGDNRPVPKKLQYCHIGDYLESSEFTNYRLPDSNWQTIFPSIENTREVVVIFTSGSTGQPKPYQKQWRDLVQVANLLAREFIFKNGNPCCSALLATVPAQHMYGLESSIMMALQNGLLLHADKPFFPQDISQCLDDFNTASKAIKQTICTNLITTPLHLKACLKTGVLLPGVQQFISATAPLDKELALSCEQRFGAQVWEIFGCTEVGSMATRRTIDTEQWTVLEDINLQSADKAGEADIHTSRSITQFPFNDIIELLDSQHFILKGRKEDVINIAGKRTSLSYLNHHLQSWPGLNDACFYQDDSQPESRLIAFVVLEHSNKSDSEAIAALKNYLKERLEAIFLPKKVFTVDALPRNATGKLPMTELRQLFKQQVKQQESR